MFKQVSFLKDNEKKKKKRGRHHVKTSFPSTLTYKDVPWEKYKGYSIKVEEKMVKPQWNRPSCDYSQFIS